MGFDLVVDFELMIDGAQKLSEALWRHFLFTRLHSVYILLTLRHRKSLWQILVLNYVNGPHRYPNTFIHTQNQCEIFDAKVTTGSRFLHLQSRWQVLGALLLDIREFIDYLYGESLVRYLPALHRGTINFLSLKSLRFFQIYKN